MLRSPSSEVPERFGRQRRRRLVPCLERATETVSIPRQSHAVKSLSTAAATTTTTLLFAAADTVRVCKRHAADAQKLRIRYLPSGILVATRRVRARARGVSGVDVDHADPNVGDARAGSVATDPTPSENEVKNEQVTSSLSVAVSPRAASSPPDAVDVTTVAPLLESAPKVSAPSDRAQRAADSPTSAHRTASDIIAPSPTDTAAAAAAAGASATSNATGDAETSRDDGSGRKRGAKEDEKVTDGDDDDDDGDASEIDENGAAAAEDYGCSAEGEGDVEGEGDIEGKGDIEGEGDGGAECAEEKGRGSDADALESCVDIDRLKATIRALTERLEAEKTRSQKLADELALSRADAKSLRQAAMDSFLRLYSDDS